jgi:hypothetical protein
LEESIQTLCVAACAQDGEAAKRLMEKFEMGIQDLRNGAIAERSEEPKSGTPTLDELKRLMGDDAK